MHEPLCVLGAVLGGLVEAERAVVGLGEEAVEHDDMEVEGGCADHRTATIRPDTVLLTAMAEIRAVDSPTRPCNVSSQIRVARRLRNGNLNRGS